MAEDRLERLLRGYRLPDVTPDLDHRILSEGVGILAGDRPRTALSDAVRSALDRLGFGYVACFIDFVTATDAEYRVVFL